MIHLLAASSTDGNPLAHFWGWFLIHTGGQNEPGSYYGEWSGFLSDVSEFAILGAILGAILTTYHHHKCVECRRVSWHKTEDTAQPFCHHHWTREHIAKHRERHRLKYPHHIAHHKETAE